MKLAEYHALPPRARAYVSADAQHRAGLPLKPEREITQEMLNGIPKPKGY